MIEPLLQAERLLLHGMVDQAEQLYRRTAEQDPLNAIAVVGLARVALERGDDELALAHARAALEIDPENAAAIRLEARLGEVLTSRSDHASAGEGSVESAPPTWSSTAPPAAPSARPSESTVFVRNPSMANHREKTRQPAGERPVPTTGRRRGLLARLLRRDRSG